MSFFIHKAAGGPGLGLKYYFISEEASYLEKTGPDSTIFVSSSVAISLYLSRFYIKGQE